MQSTLQELEKSMKGTLTLLLLASPVAMVASELPRASYQEVLEQVQREFENGTLDPRIVADRIKPLGERGTNIDRDKQAALRRFVNQGFARAAIKVARTVADRMPDVPEEELNNARAGLQVVASALETQGVSTETGRDIIRDWSIKNAEVERLEGLLGMRQAQ